MTQFTSYGKSPLLMAKSTISMENHHVIKIHRNFDA
jgi:hypothetical protein